MAILYVGIDLAKNVFAIHEVDEHGKAALVRASFNVPGCISWWPLAAVHHRHGGVLRSPPLGQAFRTAWPHRAVDGSEVRRTYRISGKRGKNDAADAQAICEAVQRGGRPLKTNLLMRRCATHQDLAIA